MGDERLAEQLLGEGAGLLALDTSFTPPALPRPPA